MTTVILAVKAVLAVMLLAAGAAKLADVSGFTTTLRLFAPPPLRGVTLRAAGVAIAGAELLIGATSFAFPELAVVNALVLAAGCAFVIASTLGYVLHRGAACRCFGQLSHRAFDAAAVGRSLGIAGLAAIVVAATISPGAVRLTAAAHVLLAAAAALLAVATFTAARVLGAMNGGQLSPEEVSVR